MVYVLLELYFYYLDMLVLSFVLMYIWVAYEVDINLYGTNVVNGFSI